MLIRRSFTLLMFAAITMRVGACSSGPGDTTTPTAGSTSTGDPLNPSGNPLASIQPCSLLTTDDLTQLGLDPGKPDNTSKSRGCEWNKGTAYSFAVYLDGSQPIEVAGSDGATKVTLQSHDAVQTAPDGLGCGVQIAISKTASVAVDVGEAAGPNYCQIALQYAGLIESKLPAQQK